MLKYKKNMAREEVEKRIGDLWQRKIEKTVDSAVAKIKVC